MKKHRGNEAPPLMSALNQEVDLGAKGNQHLERQRLRHAQRLAARLPHQDEDEDIGKQQSDGELVGAVQDRARETYRVTF